jgi:hypothetical protein
MEKIVKIGLSDRLCCASNFSWFFAIPTVNRPRPSEMVMAGHWTIIMDPRTEADAWHCCRRKRD